VIVFYNPHVDDFLAEPPHFRLLNRRPLKKYGYLLEGEIAAFGRASVLADATISAFIPDRYFSLLPKFIRRLITRLEMLRWVRINGFSGKIDVALNAEQFSEDQVLFAFSYKNAVGAFRKRLPQLSPFNKKIFHLSHYFIATAEKSANLRELKSLWLAGDADISGNAYFRKHFSWYDRPFLTLPFAVAARFDLRRPISERQPLCVATGTFHNLADEVPGELYRDYIGFFGFFTYHPVRKLIHDHSAELSNRIVSKISLYRGKAEGSAIRRWVRHFFVSQKAYFSIDIVELYNCYRYAIVGEEASGFPALGAFEAMGCGCVLIAQPEYYVGWEMQPGIHFAPHDGSIESIIGAIEFLRSRPDSAAAIAHAGRDFVNRNFRASQAYDRFVKSIQVCRVAS